MNEDRVRQIVREELAKLPVRGEVLTVDLSGCQFSREQVRELIDQINAAVADGATLRIRNDPGGDGGAAE